mmetsp:Transcript_4791/g.5689  ORF Transcript_4791/g.5689 Transcript_4791/m.5689 type:complete len:82 (-) Transcript_4791:12-257(-)
MSYDELLSNKSPEPRNTDGFGKKRCSRMAVFFQNRPKKRQVSRNQTIQDSLLKLKEMKSFISTKKKEINMKIKLDTLMAFK